MIGALTILVLLAALPASGEARQWPPFVLASDAPVQLVQAQDVPAQVYSGEEGFRQNLERWERLKPPEKRALMRRFKAWRALPPEERQRLMETHRRFKELPPDQRKMLEKRVAQFLSLDPHERRLLLERYRVWRNLPEEKRERARELLRFLRSLPPEKIRELGRMSPGERKRVIRRLMEEKLKAPMREEPKTLKGPT